MNVTPEQLEKCVAALHALGATRVLLFGSFAASPETARDVDLAVEGVPLRLLLEADAAVHDILQVPSDLLSREENPKLFAIIESTSRTLYDERPTRTADSIRA